MGHRPIPTVELEMGLLLLTGVEVVPRAAAPHPRHRLLILPAAQQFRLGVAFSSLVPMVAAHTAPPSGAACTAITTSSAGAEQQRGQRNAICVPCLDRSPH